MRVFSPSEPKPDVSQVVFLDVGNKDKSLCKHERIRAVWYVLLAALEDVETQRRGVCFVVSLKKAKLSRVISHSGQVASQLSGS